jgi:hypothetical protein
MCFKYVDKCIRGKLAARVSVEYRRDAPEGDCLLELRHEVDYSDEVDLAPPLQPDVRDVRRPDLVGQLGYLPSQEIRILLVTLSWDRCLRSRVYRTQAGLFHDPSYLLGRDVQVLDREPYFAVSVERVLSQFRKDCLENGQLALILRTLRPVVARRSADRQDPALLADREFGMIGLYSFGSVPYSCLYFFFKNSFST